MKRSITQGRNERKSKAIISCKNLEETFQECNKKEGVAFETSVETPGVDLRTRTEQLGAKGESEKEEGRCEILACQEK